MIGIDIANHTAHQIAGKNPSIICIESPWEYQVKISGLKAS
jgi:hypothetical protein